MVLFQKIIRSFLVFVFPLSIINLCNKYENFTVSLILTDTSRGVVVFLTSAAFNLKISALEPSPTVTSNLDVTATPASGTAVAWSKRPEARWTLCKWAKKYYASSEVEAIGICNFSYFCGCITRCGDQWLLSRRFWNSSRLVITPEPAAKKFQLNKMLPIQFLQQSLKEFAFNKLVFLGWYIQGYISHNIT